MLKSPLNYSIKVWIRQKFKCKMFEKLEFAERFVNLGKPGTEVLTYIFNKSIHKGFARYCHLILTVSFVKSFLNSYLNALLIIC